MIEKTCGNCTSLNFNTNHTFAIAGCKLTGYVVPHYMEFIEKRVTFWRVPIECPRGEGVLKSEKQSPKKEWIIKSFSELEGEKNNG